MAMNINPILTNNTTILPAANNTDIAINTNDIISTINNYDTNITNTVVPAERRLISGDEFDVIMSANLSTDELLQNFREYENQDEILNLINSKLTAIEEERSAPKLLKPTATSDVLKALQPSPLKSSSTTSDLREFVSSFDNETTLNEVNAEIEKVTARISESKEKQKSLKDQSKIKLCSLILTARPKLKGFTADDIANYQKEIMEYNRNYSMNIASYIPSNLIANKLEETQMKDTIYESTLNSVKTIINQNIEEEVKYVEEQAVIENKLTILKREYEKPIDNSTQLLELNA